jgi:phosphoenolpyruvate carboxykinase (ATP)
MLAEKMKQHGVNTWLIKTGWVGGQPDTTKRISLKHTRAIIDAIHSGELAAAEFTTDPVFGLSIPTKVGDVPPTLLDPQKAWPSADVWNEKATKLASRFRANFEHFAAGATPEILRGGPIDG